MLDKPRLLWYNMTAKNNIQKEVFTLRKNIFSLIAIFLLVAMMTSCAAEAPELLDFLGSADEFAVADFEGRTVYIGVQEINRDGLVPVPDDTSTKADTQWEIIKNVQNKLNCEIKQEVVDFDNVMASIIAFNCKYDVFYTHTAVLIDLIKADILYDISQMEGIDLSNEAKWGSAQDQRHRTYQGKVFGVKPRNASSTYGSLEGVIMANDSLIKEFGQPTPKELLEQGNWTFDYFPDYLVSISDMNSETPTYGMTHYKNQLCQLPLTAIFANGSSILTEDSSGKLKFDLMNDPKAVTALEWAKEVYDTGVIVEDNYDDTNAGYFTNGRSSLWLGGAWVGTTNREGFPLNEMNEGFSFMCMPYGPDAVYGETYSSFIFVSNCIAVPISSDEYEMSSFLNEFCSELSEEDMNALADETRNYYFFHPEDYDFVLDMADNAVYTYLYGELDKVRDVILNSLEDITKGSGTVSERLSSIIGKVEAELENIK